MSDHVIVLFCEMEIKLYNVELIINILSAKCQKNEAFSQKICCFFSLCTILHIFYFSVVVFSHPVKLGAVVAV